MQFNPDADWPMSQLVSRIPGHTRRLMAFIHDMVATAAAISFAYYIRYQAGLWDNAVLHLMITMAVLLPASALVNHFFGLYRGIWRFASIPDLTAILKASPSFRPPSSSSVSPISHRHVAGSDRTG